MKLVLATLFVLSLTGFVFAETKVGTTTATSAAKKQDTTPISPSKPEATITPPKSKIDCNKMVGAGKAECEKATKK